MKKLKKLKPKKLNPKKGEAYLFGPFVGELAWEFFRFAPYAIHLKKENPNVKIIVLTRQERFDLYGKYSDILVPLRITDDKTYTQSAFGLLGYDINYYETISKFFAEKYNKEYEIIGHFYPNIKPWQRKIKWQFPRIKMDYDFNVRNTNNEIVDSIVGKVQARLDQSVVEGYLTNDPAPVASAPRVTEISDIDKSNRLLPNVSFTGTVAGAIHTVQINGIIIA